MTPSRLTDTRRRVHGSRLGQAARWTPAYNRRGRDESGGRLLAKRCVPNTLHQQECSHEDTNAKRDQSDYHWRLLGRILTNDRLSVGNYNIKFSMAS